MSDYFRISRGGSFGSFGPGSLDPFGASRGGLGRYNIAGGDVATIEATQAYAISTGWQNGTISDAEYLASLAGQVGLADPASSAYITATNKLWDAQYTIARNEVVARVNAATSLSERISALNELISVDQAQQGKMTPDNEQYRELAARIVSSQVDIRQATYSGYVERYNAGGMTTDELIAAVQSLASQAGGAPDADDWGQTLTSLIDRKNDEIVATKYQDYQMGRITGQELLAFLDAKIATVGVGTPKYDELARKREDLATSIRNEDLAAAHEKIYDLWQAGKISDDTYLKDLALAVSQAKPGSREEQQAKSRLLETQFSLAEDKLRTKLSLATTETGARAAATELQKFYRTALLTMNPGSAKARSILKALDVLKGQLAAPAPPAPKAGAGTGAGTGGGKAAVATGGKAIPAPVPWQKVVTMTKDVNGKKIPANAVRDLFTFDAGVVADRNWYNNNRRMLETAQNAGASTWVYVAKDGTSYELPFSKDLYTSVLGTAVTQFGAAISAAKTPAKAQSAWSQYITQAQRAIRVEGGIAMDEYQREFSDAERGKQAALAAGDIPLYLSLVDWQRTINVAARDLPISPSQRETLAADIDSIAPYQPFPGTTDPINLKGDKLLFLADPTLPGGPILTFNQTRGADGNMVVTDVSMDRTRAFMTQDGYGNRRIVTIYDSPTAFQPKTTAAVDAQGNPIVVPAYQQSLVPMTVYNDPGLSPWSPQVRMGWAPTSQDAGLTLWMPVDDTSLRAQLKARVSIMDGKPVVGGGPTVRPVPGNTAGTAGTQLLTLPDGGVQLYTIRVWGWTPNGGMGLQTWVSTSGPGTPNALWLRLPSNSGVLPQVVLDPPKDANVRFGVNATGGLVMIGPDGKEVPPPKDMSPYIRFYDGRDATGPATYGIGGPGFTMDWTYSDSTGKVDTINANRANPVTDAYNRAQDTVSGLLDKFGFKVQPDRSVYYDPVSGRWINTGPKPKPEEPPPPSKVSDYVKYSGPTWDQPTLGVNLTGLLGALLPANLQPGGAGGRTSGGGTWGAPSIEVAHADLPNLQFGAFIGPLAPAPRVGGATERDEGAGAAYVAPIAVNPLNSPSLTAQLLPVSSLLSSPSLTGATPRATTPAPKATPAKTTTTPPRTAPTATTTSAPVKKGSPNPPAPAPKPTPAPTPVRKVGGPTEFD